MLRGADIRKYYSAPVEIYLLHGLHREEILEEIQFHLQLEATLLDRSSQEEINRFNKLLKEYKNLKNPTSPEIHVDFTEKANAMLKRFKVKKSGKIFKHDGTVKNIEKPMTLTEVVNKRRNK